MVFYRKIGFWAQKTSSLSNKFKLTSTDIMTAGLCFTTLFCIPELAFAQATGTVPEQELIMELESLAQSDVENNIARRTDFIIQVYEGDSAGLTNQVIRKVYDDAFSTQVQQDKRRKNNQRAALLIPSILGGSFATFMAFKRNLLTIKKVSVNVPFGIGQVELETIQTSRNTAWALYVEMVTRIATQQLEDDQGLLREALNSLYSLFGITRQIIRDGGPDVGASPESVGGIAIAVLNQGLRPFMAKWHPKLEIWEAQRSDGVSIKDHEKKWSEGAQMRHELKLLGNDLKTYTNALAKIAGAPLLKPSGN